MIDYGYLVDRRKPYTFCFCDNGYCDNGYGPGRKIAVMLTDWIHACMRNNNK